MTSLTWDEIGERHPELYGDPAIHGDQARHSDGEGIGGAVAHLAFDRPGHYDEDLDGQAYDLRFHEEDVDPRHIDYASHGRQDDRVARAARGYSTDPAQVPPVVLVHRHGVYQVADGHHRAEAAHLVGSNVHAYVAYSPHENEPFHRDQDDEDDEDLDRAPFHGAEPHPGIAEHRKEQLRFHASAVRRRQVTAAEDDDYRLQHKSPGSGWGAPMHDIEHVMPDIYEHPEWYRYGHVGYDESFHHIRRVRGNPDAQVKIYRALPAEHAHKGFQTGDWVSPSKEYARRHGWQQNERGHDDWPVISTTVSAKHLFNEGEPTEFGYHGPSQETAEVAFKGGRNQEVRQHADGVVRKVVRRDKEASVDRIAVLQGFNSGGRLRSVASYPGPRLRVYAHVSGNSIDAIHCPFCGSGAVFARSDGTIECSFCTSVYTVQVQPQFAAFPQTAEQMPYQWPGRPGPDQLAGGGDGAMGGFPGPIAGEQDQGTEEGGPEDGNPFGSSDDAGESDGDSGEGPVDKDAPDKAQVGGKDKPPFGKKSYRTAAGHQLNEPDYLRHLAIGHAHRRGEVARLVRDSR